MQEIELKLSIPARHAGELWKTTAVASRLRARPIAAKLFSAYYDTPDFALWRQGATVRLRRDSDRWIQTVKGGGNVAAGLHTRTELETEVPVQSLDYPALVEAGLGKLIGQASQRRAVGVVFTTTFVRRRALIGPTPGTSIELALDRGEIAAGERHARICEIELELKSGEPRALFALARELVRELPLRLENASKPERGYGLAAGETDQPRKAEPVALEEQMGVDAAFAATVSACLRHLQSNEHGVLTSTDPEYVHQARVALRRLRCAFSAFSLAIPRKAFDSQRTGLKEIAGALGQARDWDVFAAELLTEAGSAGAAVDLALVERLAGAARARACAAARSAMGSTQYTLLLLDLAEPLLSRAWQAGRNAEQSRFAAMPLPEFCAQALARRDRKARQRGKEMKASDPASLHALRIEIKKLRYACEFFAPLFGRERAREYLGGLTALQSVLGEINDLATAVSLLDTLSAHKSAARLATALEYLRGYGMARMRSSLSKLDKVWARLDRARPFWQTYFGREKHRWT